MKEILYKNIPVGYTDQGKGSVIVLLHGFLENKKMWTFHAEQLSKKYRVITIDLLGHGETPCYGYVHTMESNAEVVAAVLNDLRIRKAVFAGHSMGGYVALAFAELNPEMVKGVVLVNSTTKADSDERKANRDRAIVAVKQNYLNFVRMSISNLFSENNREKMAREIEDAKVEALKTPLQGIVASLEGMKIRKDREVLLHFAAFPTLLILGKKDTVLPYDDTIAQLEGTRTQLVSFDDGHMSPVENKDELLDALADFCKNVK